MQLNLDFNPVWALLAFPLQVNFIILNRQGGNSQNFFSKFVRFFVTLGLKILRLSRLKVVFETDIIKR